LAQPPQAPRDVHAKLTDELSECVTFRSDLMVERLETEIAFEFLINGSSGSVDRSQSFTYSIDYIGDSYLNFSSSFTDDAINKTMEF
jgi:hypothetical protein